MLAKSNRFSFKKRIPKHIFNAELFTIRYDKNTEGKLLCAVIVGKKVDKRAVARNKIKRMIVQALKEYLLGKTQYTIVLYAKKPTATVTYEIIQAELENALTKINIL